MTTFSLGGCHLNGLSIRNASANVSTSPWFCVFIVGLIGAGRGVAVAFGVVTLLVTEAAAVDTFCALIDGTSFGVVTFLVTEAAAVDTFCGLIGGTSFGVVTLLVTEAAAESLCFNVIFGITVNRRITYDVQKYLTTFHDFCESKDIV